MNTGRGDQADFQTKVMGLIVIFLDWYSLFERIHLHRLSQRIIGTEVHDTTNLSGRLGTS